MEGGAIVGEGGSSLPNEANELLCPRCNEPVAPLQAICANCGESLPSEEDELTDADRTAELLASTAGDWGHVGIRLIFYTGALALAIALISLTIYSLLKA